MILFLPPLFKKHSWMKIVEHVRVPSPSVLPFKKMLHFTTVNRLLEERDVWICRVSLFRWCARQINQFFLFEL